MIETPEQEAARAAALTELEREFDYMVTQVRRTTRLRANQVSEGLLPGGYKVFTTIGSSGPMTLSELTEQLLSDKGQMSRTVRDLEERGLVTRTPDPDDGRSTRLSLSEFGHERLRAARGGPETMLRGAMSEWSVTDIARFTELLHALAHGLTP